MITNKDIITGLHRKRNAANGILDSMKRKPRIDLQAISERKWRSFIKTYGNINESPMKGMDEMPKKSRMVTLMRTSCRRTGNRYLNRSYTQTASETI